MRACCSLLRRAFHSHFAYRNFRRGLVGVFEPNGMSFITKHWKILILSRAVCRLRRWKIVMKMNKLCARQPKTMGFHGWKIYTSFPFCLSEIVAAAGQWHVKKADSSAQSGQLRDTLFIEVTSWSMYEAKTRREKQRNGEKWFCSQRSGN